MDKDNNPLGKETIKKIIDLGNIGKITYKEVAAIVATVVKKAKATGMKVDSQLVCNELTGKIDVILTRKK